jgi:hypothetical protein
MVPKQKRRQKEEVAQEAGQNEIINIIYQIAIIMPLWRFILHH